jgi:hypothetical protein
MKKRYYILPVVLAVAGGSISLLQTERSPQALGILSETHITRPGRASLTLNSSDERIKLDPRESISLDLKLNPGKGQVRIVAPNGGSINHGRGHAAFDPPAQGQSIHFDFDAGETPGRYTIEVAQGLSTKTLEFWVGPEPPQGEPGPARTFTN